MPVDIQLKVTMRVHEARSFKPLPQSSVVSVAEQGVKLTENGIDYDTYESYALLQVNKDSRVSYGFRWYDKDGIQVAECEPTEVQVEPEVNRRVKCEKLISRESRKPVSVKTVVRDVR